MSELLAILYIGGSVAYTTFRLLYALTDPHQTRSSLEDRIKKLENKCQESTTKPAMNLTLIVNKPDGTSSKTETYVVPKDTETIMIDS
jgi:hypothetical protein